MENTQSPQSIEFNEQKEICALIGLALVEIQGVEKLIKHCMALVFKDDHGNAFADLQNPLTRKKPMGYFLTALRQKSQLDAMFDEVLTNFLNRRNEFVHDLLGNNLFCLKSRNGRHHIRMFLERLRSEGDLVRNVMMGALMVWIDPEKFADSSRVLIQFREGTWLGDAEQIFAPRIKTLFGPKADNGDRQSSG